MKSPTDILVEGKTVLCERGEIERLRAALQLIAADVTGNKFHQAQFRQDTARAALESAADEWDRKDDATDTTV